ncbi:MAG: MBL fold metallo-hydrolase [Chitinophagaceae bacterium]|nr:MBL fold metallo-hydrolase [Chitinophagaceae bacterium]MCW5925619.1 MBL fold metallo-hydrolase [Chitinophagaceae bacterium]
MQVIPLSEGSFTVDHSKQFVPFDKDRDDLKQRPPGSLLVEIQPFIIITSRDILLLDTGLGFNGSGNTLQLYENIVANNINPADITKVLVSHLHKDHAGGISFKDAFNNRQIAFPQATYYLQEREYQYAVKKGMPSYIPEEFDILDRAGNVVFLQEDEGLIDQYIHYQLTAGHSPFHQVFWIEEEGEIVFFGADEAPQLKQMKNRFAAKYDYDGRKSMELRQKWWDAGNDTNWMFLFYHDVKNPTYRDKE